MPTKLCRIGVCSVLFALAAFAAAQSSSTHHDSRLEGSYRFERGGWTYVHLQGSPEQIGFQHGYLLGGGN